VSCTAEEKRDRGIDGGHDYLYDGTVAWLGYARPPCVDQRRAGSTDKGVGVSRRRNPTRSADGGQTGVLDQVPCCSGQGFLRFALGEVDIMRSPRKTEQCPRLTAWEGVIYF